MLLSYEQTFNDWPVERPAAVGGTARCQDDFMAAIARYQQIIWLRERCDSTPELLDDLTRTANELTALLAKARRSTWTRRPGCRVKLWSATDAHPNNAVIIDATEQWALLDTDAPLVPGATATLEHRRHAPLAILHFRGDVVFTSGRTSLLIFDGPATLT